MPRKPAEEPMEDSPSKVGTRKDVSIRLTSAALASGQLCVHAADLRARHMSYQAIALELGLSSPAVAKTAVENGLALQPTENLRALRRVHGLRLERAGREALARIEDPGPLVSQGKIMYNEATGEPYPDNTNRIQALQTWIKLLAEERKFYGTDAPKRSVSLVGEIPESYLQAHIEQLRAELGITGEEGEPPALAAG